jgi:hypothetical protein
MTSSSDCQCSVATKWSTPERSGTASIRNDRALGKTVGDEHEHEQQYYTKVIFRDLKAGLGLTPVRGTWIRCNHSLTSVDGDKWLAPVLGK